MPINGSSMRRFLNQKMEHDCEDVSTQNPVKNHLNSIAVGNPLTDEDHNVLPSRSMKLILSAECTDRDEKLVRNVFYAALNSIEEQASSSNISLEVSDSYAGSRGWTPRYNEAHLVNLRRCFRDTHKCDDAYYFYIMWLSEYGELELPTRINRQLLDAVRDNLPSMLGQEHRLFDLLLLPYTNDTLNPDWVRLLCPHEYTASFQDFEQIVHNSWAALLAVAFHDCVPESGDHPLLQLRHLLKSRMHLEYDEISAADPVGAHTKFIYRAFSEEEQAAQQRKIQINEQRFLLDTKRAPYLETKEHTEELNDKDVCRFFFEGVPAGSIKKRIRSECARRYQTLLEELMIKFGPHAISWSASDSGSLVTLQTALQANFLHYSTSIIHATSSIAAESIYRGVSLHWKENDRILHNQINFSCRRDLMRDLTDAIINQVLDTTNSFQNELSLKVLISGPSGSGKSTFLAAAAKLLSKSLGQRSVIMIRYPKLDSQCKSVVGLLQSISAQIALLVPGASGQHAQMSAKQHLVDLSASIFRLCSPSFKASDDEEKIRLILLIDDFDTLDADAVELLDSWIPVGFHPHFSIIATTCLDYSDKKLNFLKNAGLKRQHMVFIPPFDAELRSVLIAERNPIIAVPLEPVEDIASIMANTGIFIKTKSAPSSRPQTSASVSISLSGKHKSIQVRSFTDANVSQSINEEASHILDYKGSESFNCFPTSEIADNILQSAAEFKSFELAIRYLSFSTWSSIPKHITIVAFIQKTLDSAVEEFGLIFVSHAMAYITFSRDHMQRSELLALLSADEDVLAEARNKNHDVYSGSSTIKFPASLMNSFLDNCILLQVIIPQRCDVLICDNALLIAAWCIAQKGFDHKAIHSNMAMYFLGTWKSDGLRSQPLEMVHPPAPAQINFRRIREGPYHAILAEEFTLAGQEVARYSYIETCYRHGQGHEAAYYLKLLAGYIHSNSSSEFTDPDLQQRINDYWLFVHCNHHKLCLNVGLLSNLACSANPRSNIFEDAATNAQYNIQWNSSTMGFRLPRNSSVDNLRCFRSLPNIAGVPSLCISSNHRFAFVADNTGFLHKCELTGQRGHSKSFLFAIKRLLAICCDQTGSSIMTLYIDEVMHTTDIPESEGHIDAHTCNLFVQWPQSVCIAVFSGEECSLIIKTGTAGVVVHSMIATSVLTNVYVGGLNFTDDFLSQCSSNNITAVRSTTNIVSDVDGKYILGAKDRVLEIYKETKILQAITMDRTILCAAISPDGCAAAVLIIGNQVDIFAPDRAGLKWLHHGKLQFASTITNIAISSGCYFLLTALNNGCVQLWSIFEKKKRRRANIALEHYASAPSENDEKSFISRSLVDEGPLQSMFSHGLVIFMTFVQENDSLISVIFDSSGTLGEWTFPNQQMKHPTVVIAIRPSIPVYNSLCFNCGLSSEIIWADATAGLLTTLSSTGDLNVTSLTSGFRVAKTLLSSNFRVTCVSVIEQLEKSVDPTLRFVMGFQDGCIRLINQSWSCEFEGKINHSAITCIDTLRRTNRTVSLIGSLDASLVLFDITSRVRICTLPKQHTASIAAVQMYKDTGLSLGHDRQITVWDLTLRRVKMVITCASNFVACSFACLSTMLYSVSDDAKLRVHSTESHKERFSFSVNPKPKCMHVLQSGNKVVCGHLNGDVVVYNVQRRLAAFKLEGHVSSVSSVSFVLKSPFPALAAEDSDDAEIGDSVKEFEMILSTSVDMSTIIWSPLLRSHQLQQWNSSLASSTHEETNSLFINRSQAHTKDAADFSHIAVASRSGSRDLQEGDSPQDVMKIQNRVSNYLKFEASRRNAIPSPAPIIISATRDPEKEFQASSSIFQNKSTAKLGKLTRKLVNRTMETFNMGTTHPAKATLGMPGKAAQAIERSPAMLTTSPLRFAHRSLPPKFASPADWIESMCSDSESGFEV